MRIILFSFLALVLIGIISGDFEIIGEEKYTSAIQLEHQESAQQLQAVWNVDLKERKEACEDAKNMIVSTMKVNFIFTPYRYKPEVLKYDFINLISKPGKCTRHHFHSFLPHSDEEEDEEDEDETDMEASFGSFAMYCHTLPSIYVRISTSQSEITSTKYLKAVFIRPSFDSFLIESPNEKPKIVYREGGYYIRNLNENPLVKMNLEERRSLCIAGSENHTFSFFSNNVPEASVYELEYSPQKKEITIGILCPVIPAVLLHQKVKSSQLNLSFIQIPVEEYVYSGYEVIASSQHKENQEELKSSILSRDYQTGWSFCTHVLTQIPRNKRNLFVIHKDWVGIAKVYNFTQHPSGTKVSYTAVQCAEAPTMFLRLDESKKEMKIMIFPSTGDKLSTPSTELTDHPDTSSRLNIFSSFA